MIMRLHDECWWKCGRSQRLCRHDMHPWALKPSHIVKACVLSNHVNFRRIQAQVEGILTFSPFPTQRATSMDTGIGDRLVIGRRSMTFQECFEHWPDSPLNMQNWWIMALVVGFLNGWLSMTFQESFDKDSIDGNGEWRQWDYMMNIDENMDDLKHHVGTTCILEPWNPPTPWKHVSYLTMSNFDAYTHKLKEFQRWPLSLLNVQCRWIMASVMSLLEDVPWHFKRGSTKLSLIGMASDYNEIAWWTLMKMWTISNIKWARHASLSLETLPQCEGMCLI